MNKKSLQEIFSSYFHNKYTFETFLKTTTQENVNYKITSYEKYYFVSYIKDKKNKLTYESQKLKDFHIFINTTILKKLQIHESVYSYKENKNVYDMIYTHKDSKSYFKTDIANFFGSITKDLVKKTLKENIENFNININVDYFDNIINLLFIDDKLPVGFITSPNISNSVLFEFDKYFSHYANKRNLFYTRYSDDLVFSSQDYQKLINIKNDINSFFNTFHNGIFKLKLEKTEFLDKTKKVSILGLTITPNGHVTVDKYKKENIQKLIYFYKTDKNKFINFLEQKYNNQLNKAYGSLNYINDIDKNFILKLRKKYGNYVIDKFLHGTKN